MTTVVFRDGVMASDSQCTSDIHSFLTNARKLFRLKSGAILGTAGDGDAREVISLCDTVTNPDTLPSKDALSETRTRFEGLLYLPDKTLWLINVERTEVEYGNAEWNGYVDQITNTMAAVGSGAAFAYGAMGHGATAEEAVRSAIKFDIYSSGRIQTMELEG